VVDFWRVSNFHLSPFDYFNVFRYANRGSYDKAITDFEAALKERPNHANATNYLSETLVAYAKQ
jgi:hypothetical protein